MKNSDKIKELRGQIEALTVAVPREETAHRFYLELAQGTSHKGAKSMYLRLAEQELRHKHDLEAMIEELKRQVGKLQEGHEEEGLWDLT